MHRGPSAPAASPRIAAGLRLAAAGLTLTLFAGCAADDDGTSASIAAPAPGAVALLPDAEVGAPSTSPENPRDQMRREAWESAIAGVALVDGRLTVTQPLAAAGLAADRAEADAMIQVNRRTATVGALVRVVRRDSASAADWNDLGGALARRGRPELAEGAHRTALALDPADPDAGRELAIIAGGRGDFAAAADRMRRHLDQHPGDGVGHARLAAWSWYLGDAPAARRHIAAADRLGATVPPQLRAALEAAAAPAGTG